MFEWIKRALTFKSVYNRPYSWAGNLSASKAGVTVTEANSLSLSAVHCAVRILAEAVSSLPLCLYRRTADGGKERAYEHPLYRLLREEPNPEQTSVIWRESLEIQRQLWCGAFCEIERDGSGRPVALWPLPAWQVTVGRNDAGQLLYKVGTDTVLAPQDVLHIPSLTQDGIVGTSTIHHARQTLALAMALDVNAASFFGNSSRPGAILKYAGQLSETARENLRRSWEALHSGPGNVGRTCILEEGVGLEPLSHSNESSQLAELREQVVSDVCRFFNLPLHKCKLMQQATYANVEFENISFLQDTIRPILVRYEMELNRKLLLPEERQTYFFEHLIEATLRADITTKMSVGVQGIQNGIFSINEVRQRDWNLAGIGPEGDIYRVPLNTGPAAQEQPKEGSGDTSNTSGIDSLSFDRKPLGNGKPS